MRKQFHTHKRFRSDGSVLVLTLILLMISFIIGTSLMALSEHSQLNSMRLVETTYARSAADAGLHNALQAVNTAAAEGTLSACSLPSGDHDSLPYSDALYSYITSYSSMDGYQIECTGIYKNPTHTVRAKLTRQSLFEYGISCRTFLNVDAGALLDSYDSRISDDPADCEEKIVIGSLNEDYTFINLDNGVTIDGDVFCGPGLDTGLFIADHGATITGQAYATDSPATYPVLTPPTYSGPDTTITFSRTEKTIGQGGDYPATGRFDTVNLGTSATLRVVGDCCIYVANAVNLGAKSGIVIEPDSSLTIYVGRGWNSGTDCNVENLTGNPANLCIIQTADHFYKMDIQAKNDFSGIIYAPKCGLDVSTGSDFRGAVVADWFKLHNSGRFLYDVALKDYGLGGGGTFEIDRWCED